MLATDAPGSVAACSSVERNAPLQWNTIDSEDKLPLRTSSSQHAAIWSSSTAIR